jgi:dihydropteroate synthase
MIDAGASMVDIGGMTAQPGGELPAREEAARIEPVVRAVRESRPQCVISVDTYRAAVASAALAAGADIINDHTGLSDDDLAAAVADRGGGLVITHLGLQPKQVQDTRYSTSQSTIRAFLEERATRAERAGVSASALLIDPGLGFGKTTETDLETLRALPELLALGRPVLLACSHKEVTAEPLGLPEESLEGTAAVVAVASYLGVHVLRVHDLPFMERVSRMGWLARPG